MPISYLQGELFQADVTCGVTSGKLMFKFNGTRILSNRGTQLYASVHMQYVMSVYSFKICH